MTKIQAILWTFIGLCVAVFAICVYLEPDKVSDSLEHFVFHAAYVGLLVMLADVTIRYKERGGVKRR